jgi:hypothetical protein
VVLTAPLPTPATQCTARVDKALMFYPNSKAGPFLAGMITWVAGSFFRYMEQKGRGVDVKVFWSAPGQNGAMRANDKT